MELRNRVKRLMPPPGGDRRGAPGADAGCYSMRAVGGKGTSRRTLAGSKPEEVTSSQTHIDPIHESLTPPAVDVSTVASAMRPETTKAGKPRVRMKWDKDMNIFIMRTYFKITNLETNLTQYRQKLHQHFTNKYSNNNVSEQRLSDQLRAITRNKFLSPDEIKVIREEVKSSLEQNQNSNTSNMLIDDIHNHCQNNINTEPFNVHQHSGEANTPNNYSQNTTTNESHIQDECCEKTLRSILEENLSKYKNSDPTSRLSLPKLRSSYKLSYIINIFNKSILREKLSTLDSILDTHTLIYCTAITIITYLNIKVKNKTNRINKFQPAWQMRLKADIDELRRDIGRLTQYKNGNRGKYLMKKINKILEKTKKHSSHDDNNKHVIEYLDTLKQKLAVKCHRLARYNKAQSRKDNNKLFSFNEKQFYRKLKGKTEVHQPPSSESFQNYWENIWTHSIKHNKDAEWINNEKIQSETITEMEFQNIELAEFRNIVNKTHSWKAPGVDYIQNFWFKKLHILHYKLIDQITDIIKGNTILPEFLTKGVTYMIPKSNKTNNPSQYRPITCLPTLYKIITSCITYRISKHLETNKILTEEQKGCKKLHRGCKEQLIIDSTVLKHVQKSQKSLFVSYIDYKKAFDSIPHTWLIEILEIYKISPIIINFLKKTMQNWKTTIHLKSNFVNISTRIININRGIFQGDSLSPLWFCVALNPLSKLLNISKLGFEIKSNRKTLHRLSHLLYMDDLKLYSSKEANMVKLLDITTNFSADIRMNFGLDKCRKLNIVKGKITEGDYKLSEQDSITAMKNNELYKYLGYNQARLLDHKSIKDKLKKEYFSRINLLGKQQLCSKNLFKALNTYAIPVLTYSFGIIKWSNTDIKQLESKTRTTLTQNRFHHPKSAIERVTLAREVGGRGLIDITYLHNKQLVNLKQFFYHKKNESKLHETIIAIDNNFTPLNLKNESTESINKKDRIDEKTSNWKKKELHGRHPNDLEQLHVDKDASNKWLSLGGLFTETEGFMLAIQDQVITTKNYRKYIVKDRTLDNDLCRKCQSKPETIQHITGACISLTQNDYTHRHNQLVNIIHQKLVLKFKLTSDPHTPYYKYIPRSVLENLSYTLYYDRTILTDHTIYNNRPDITFVDKNNKHTYLIDIAVPNTNNLQSTISEKIRKYTELQQEIKRVWKMDNVTIVPIVISTTGVVPKALLNSLKILDLPKFTYITLQKAAILNTCRIVRKFLQLDSDGDAVTINYNNSQN